MSYEFYKVLHLLCILALACGLGGLAVLSLTSSADDHKGLRKGLMIVHGVALLVIFVAGFGMMARKGIGIGAAGDTGWPGWIFGKMGIWLALGGMAAFIKRKADLSWHALWAVPVLGALAAYLAVVHPGAAGG
ncbi:MAG: hypothetical protein AAF721_34810 [Myxococcota bacterium]